MNNNKKNDEIPKWDDTEEIAPSFDDTTAVEAEEEKKKISKGKTLHSSLAQGVTASCYYLIVYFIVRLKGRYHHSLKVLICSLCYT